MKNVYIVSAVRTAVGSYGGSLKDISAPKLASIVTEEALKRANVKKEDVNEVILGQVLSAGVGQNLARQAVIGAGLPLEVPGMTVNKVCGSGLKTVAMAGQVISCGDAEVVVAGGAESMSQAPYISRNMRWGARMGDVSMVDYMIHDGLFDVFNGYHMGITAENVAEKYGITREMQDALALGSQTKATAALESGRFADEIVPVEIKVKKETKMFATDEYIKTNTTAEVLAKLRPAFKKDGSVTAGNASGINDGAAALVVVSEEYVKANNLKPLVKIVSSGSVGCDPSIMGIGPVESVKQALAKANMTVADLDLVEANEAFAAQAMAVNNELGLNPEIVNVNGGAIAIGHPIGASGARVLTTLIHEMIKRDVTNGLATLCIGGGMGEALIVTRDELCK